MIRRISAENADVLVEVDIPYFDYAGRKEVELRLRNEAPSVGTEGNIPDGLRMAAQSADLPAGVGVPHLYGLVGAGGSQLLAVRAKGDPEKPGQYGRGGYGAPAHYPRPRS